MSLQRKINEALAALIDRAWELGASYGDAPSLSEAMKAREQFKRETLKDFDVLDDETNDLD